MFQRTCRMQLWQPRRKGFDKRLKLFFDPRPRMMEKIRMFTRKYVCSNCSYGHAGCSFVNHFENLSTRRSKSFAQGPKTTGNWKKFYRNWFFLQKFVRTCRMKLWQPRRKLFDKRPDIVVLNVREWQKKLEVFRKNFFPQKVSMDT